HLGERAVDRCRHVVRDLVGHLEDEVVRPQIVVVAVGVVEVGRAARDPVRAALLRTAPHLVVQTHRAAAAREEVAERHPIALAERPAHRIGRDAGAEPLHLAAHLVAEGEVLGQRAVRLLHFPPPDVQVGAAHPRAGQLDQDRAGLRIRHRVLAQLELAAVRLENRHPSLHRGSSLEWIQRKGRRSRAPLSTPGPASRMGRLSTQLPNDKEDSVKLLLFDDFKLGVLRGDGVVDVSDVVKDVPHTGPGDLMSGLIARFADYRKKIEDAAGRGKPVPVAKVRIRPPLPKPTNIVCMAVNYMEDGTRTEPAPINAFMKSPGAIIGPAETMVLPDVPATIFEGEAEMALVIGKRATAVPAARAMEYVFGYCNFIDGSARGLLPPGNTFYQMKSRDTFAPMGPYLVTADEITDPHKLAIRLSVNGTVKQAFNTSDMAHKIPRCIEWVTSIHTLEPGDVLATGTNHRGLSGFQDGDRIELECEGLGKLQFNIRDELKRTWSRETRLDRQEKGQEGTTPQLTGKHKK